MNEFDLDCGRELPSEIVATPVRGVRCFDVIQRTPGQFQLNSLFANYPWRPTSPEGPHEPARCNCFPDQGYIADLQKIIDFEIPRLLPGDTLTVDFGVNDPVTGAHVALSLPLNLSTNTTISTNAPKFFGPPGPMAVRFSDPNEARAYLEKMIERRKAFAEEHQAAVPVASCMCGYWMVKDVSCLGYAVGSYYWLGAQPRAVALVEGWGRIIEHDNGYRCQYMRVLDLELIGIYRDEMSTARGAAHSLSKRYGVPCKVRKETYSRYVTPFDGADKGERDWFKGFVGIAFWLTFWLMAANLVFQLWRLLT